MIHYLVYAWTHYRVDSAMQATLVCLIFAAIMSGIIYVTCSWYRYPIKRWIRRTARKLRHVLENLLTDEEDREERPDWASPKLWEASKIPQAERRMCR